MANLFQLEWKLIHSDYLMFPHNSPISDLFSPLPNGYDIQNILSISLQSAVIRLMAPGSWCLEVYSVMSHLLPLTPAGIRLISTRFQMETHLFNNVSFASLQKKYFVCTSLKLLSLDCCHPHWNGDTFKSGLFLSLLMAAISFRHLDC